MDYWIVPAFPSGSAPHRALKTGRCSKLDPNVLVSFLTQCYYPHTSRESVFPVCGIYFYFYCLVVFCLFDPVTCVQDYFQSSTYRAVDEEYYSTVDREVVRKLYTRWPRGPDRQKGVLQKLDRVAPLIADPPLDNSTTMHIQ